MPAHTIIFVLLTTALGTFVADMFANYVFREHDEVFVFWKSARSSLVASALVTGLVFVLTAAVLIASTIVRISTHSHV